MGKSKSGRKQAPRRKGPTPRKRRVEASERVSPLASTRPSGTGAGTATPSGARYTPPVKNRGMFRPLWHKLIGGLLIVLGVAIFVINDLEWFDIHLMPGGHNELYALLGISVAVSSTWWFGLFDRSPTRW